MQSSRGIDARRAAAAGGASAPTYDEAAARTWERATAELSAELARIEDRYKRALADLDNYRKRSRANSSAGWTRPESRCCTTGWTSSTASSGRCRWRPTARAARVCGPSWPRSTPCFSVRARSGSERLASASTPSATRRSPCGPARVCPTDGRRGAAVRVRARRAGRSAPPRSWSRARPTMRADGGRLPGLLRDTGGAPRRERRGHPARVPQARAQIPP